MSSCSENDRCRKIWLSVSSWLCCKNILVSVFFLLFAVLIFIFVSLVFVKDPSFLRLLKENITPVNKDELQFIGSVFIGLLSILGLIIGYSKLSEIQSTNKAEMLIKLQERFDNPNSLKSRKIIYFIDKDRAKTKTINEILSEIINYPEKDDDGTENLLERALKDAGDDGIRKGSSIKLVRFYLLEFLNLLEMIGYLHSLGKIDSADMFELFAEIKQHHADFNYAIEEMRKLKADNTLYEHFENLVKA